MPPFRPFLLLFLLAAWSAGCGDHTAPPAGTLRFTDDLGRTVALERPVRRVVTVAPSLTEIVFAAGAGDRLVGVTTADDHPPAVDTLPRFSALPVNFEAVAALQPDVVLATSQINNPRDAETFAALGIPMVFFSFRTLDDVTRVLRSVGMLLDTGPAAEAAADSLERRIAALRARTDTLSSRPRVLFLIGDETLFAFGAGSYIHTLIALAGGASVTADLTTEAPILSDEFVLTARPDVIAGAFGEDYDPARLLERHPTWHVVPAVQAGRIYGLPPALFLRPGPRLVEGAYRLAARLHPGLLPDTAGAGSP
ncbi:ABC transporter substrate-binding protein [Rhodocaloribacter litoris]|uniref:ABC transporter substrate-binding protein n=1 Tax=Rhodocaloribacter litoris TaxID=2558931 RepID=UPI0014243A02|nr:helical backbone metal receptor [Rhodocaloribacter litoris]QXD15016.1 ABC transporter substrate-binding protein [Rhodocaloribacter litoris]GIV62191.1 MAG: periplasmic-binding protein [Rhodothermaceae bacterium]